MGIEILIKKDVLMYVMNTMLWGTVEMVELVEILVDVDDSTGMDTMQSCE